MSIGLRDKSKDDPLEPKSGVQLLSGTQFPNAFTKTTSKFKTLEDPVTGARSLDLGDEVVNRIQNLDNDGMLPANKTVTVPNAMSNEDLTKALEDLSDALDAINRTVI